MHYFTIIEGLKTHQQLDKEAIQHVEDMHQDLHVLGLQCRASMYSKYGIGIARTCKLLHYTSFYCFHVMHIIIAL